MNLTPGKYIGLVRLTNEIGQFMMLALDQRGSLQKMISGVKGNWKPEDLREVKSSILKNLSEHATAVLFDTEFGFPENIIHIPRNTGIILAAERSGYVTDDSAPEERLTELVSQDITGRIKNAGADALKLLVYWSENSSEKTKKHQKNIVRQTGMDCRKEDIPYILEIITYNISTDKKTRSILHAMSTFSGEEYGVDVFKVEPIAKSRAHNLTSSEVYEVSGGKPWVILSGGMPANEFKDLVRYNCELGASGFLAGRVVWKKSVDFIENPANMELFLKGTGYYYLSLLKTNALSAVPFHCTPLFNSKGSIELKSNMYFD